MFQRDKRDRLAYQLVEHVRARDSRGWATRGEASARARGVGTRMHAKCAPENSREAADARARYTRVGARADACTLTD